MEKVGPASCHKEVAVPGHSEGPVVRGRAKGRRDLVLIIQTGGVPSMNGVILEAGQHCVGQRHKEHLHVITIRVSGWYST